MSQDNSSSNNTSTNNTAAPAAPVVSGQQQIGGVTRISIRPDHPGDAGQNFEHQTGTPLDAEDPNGPRLGFANGNPSTYQSFSVGDLPSTTSFMKGGYPCAPNEATHVRLGDGTVTSVEAAKHLGLIEMHNDGPRASGKMLRGGQIIEGREAAAYLEAERFSNEWNARVAERKQIAAAYGDEAAAQWWQESGNAAFEAQLRQQEAAIGQALSDPRWNGVKPALTPIPEAEFQAQQQARAQSAQQAKAQAEQQRTMGVPDHVNADVPQLRAAEVAQTAGVKPDAVSYLRHSLAQAVVSGDNRAIDRAVGVFADHAGIPAQRAAEIAATVGKQLGAPVKLVAERAGVNPQALMSAMQQADPVAFSEAFVQVAQTRNASGVLRLAMRVLNAHRARGGR